MSGSAPYSQKRLSFDFDGVLHSCSHGWQGPDVIGDPPVEGMAVALHRLAALGWTLSVCSSRARYPDGKAAMEVWLADHGFPQGMEITSENLPAEIYIDDRALRFDGCVPAMLEAIDTWKGPWTMGAQIPGR